MAQRYKGGRDAAQKRYIEKNRDKRNAQKRAHYQENRDKIREKQSKYREVNIVKILEYNAQWQRETRKRVKADMIKAYGAACACCGETEPMFLELDHINNDGAAERKKHQNQFKEWLYLQKMGWPRDRHQLLCSNCNRGKQKNGGICPHKKDLY